MMEAQRTTELSQAEIKAHNLLHAAREVAIKRSSGSPEAVKRIGTALEKRFLPYVLENETIAEQISSLNYLNFASETRTFLSYFGAVRAGFIVCPDGRIISVSLADPRVGSVHRRLQGLPEIRRSSQDRSKMVLNDPDLAASIESWIELAKEEDSAKKDEIKRIVEKPQIPKIIPQETLIKDLDELLVPTATDDQLGFDLEDIFEPELIEFEGPHIQSQHPEEGCGAFKAKIQRAGRTPELGMKFGGIPEYFEELGEGFYAFDNVAMENGGKGTTFDLIHDAHTQGFIIGLKQAYKEFDPNQSLRENLTRLAQEGKILVTDETLMDAFRQTILDKAKKLGVEGKIDIRDYKEFGKNMILIGTIAKELTVEEEKKGLKWIPPHLIEGKSESARRVLAYHVLRNMVYRTLSGIESGNHPLLKHPEQLTRIGPIGADFNVQNIPFIQSTPKGGIGDNDKEATRGIHNIAYGVMREQGVDLSSEGRIIMVTGAFDKSRYGDPRVAREEFNEVKSVVRNNASWIRELFVDSVKTGETIVIGCIHEQGTRRLTHVV